MEKKRVKLEQVVEKPSSRQVWWVLGVFLTGGGGAWCCGPFSRRVFFWFRALNINKLLFLTATRRFSYLKAEMATTVRWQAFGRHGRESPLPFPQIGTPRLKNLKQPLCRHILFLAQHTQTGRHFFGGVRMKKAEQEHVVARFPFH